LLINIVEYIEKALVISALFISSYKDIKTRYVGNNITITLIVILILLKVIKGRYYLLSGIFSAMFLVLPHLTIYWLNQIGGADIKLIFAIGIFLEMENLSCWLGIYLVILILAGIVLNILRITRVYTDKTFAFIPVIFITALIFLMK